jgi:hypothetical protein
VAWTAVDRLSGVASYDVRWRSARLDRALGHFKTWQNGIRARDATFEGTPGRTYCFITRATDRAGNRSGWSPEVCTTTPLRAADLEARELWVPAVGPVFYANGARIAALQGSTLRTGRVRAKRLALVASRFPSSGVVDVMWNGELLRRIDLAGDGVRSRLLIELTPFSRVRAGRVTVRVVGADQPVVIEGLGVARR